MHILITGANGFLGAHVVRACLARSHRVRVLVRPHIDLADLEWRDEVEVFRCDLRDSTSLIDAVTGVDVVIHLAAQVLGDEDEQFEGTAVATERLVEAMARGTTRRMVLASSLSVYDWSGAKRILDESVAVDPRLGRRGGYAVAKVWQERVACRAADEGGSSLTILRPGFIWGRGRDEVPGVHFAAGPFRLVLGLRRRLPLTHVQNCADCFALAAEGCSEGIQVYNVVDSDEVTAWRFAQEQKRRTGARGILVPLPYHAVRFVALTAGLCSRFLFGARGRLPSILMPERLAVFKSLRFPTTAVRKRYGWQPRLNFAAALEQTFRWPPELTGNRPQYSTERPRKLRIAIYHPWIYVKSGLERTIMEIFGRSRHQWTIYTSHYDRERTYPELQSMNVIEVNRVSVVRQYGAVIRGAMSIASIKLDLSGHDALVVCCDGLGSLINFRNHDVPVICLCFTPLRAVYDHEYRSRHVARVGMLRPLASLAELAWRAVDRIAWRYYRHVFCISDTVRKRVLGARLCRAEDIEIAYAGVASEKIQASDTCDRVFLVPGRIMWTKNVELAIDAFREFRNRHGRSDFTLVIAGMVDQKSQPYLDTLRSMAAEISGISFSRDLTDGEMEALYRRCYAVLFTPFNEDQGLTPIEAGMHGKPVIAVNRGGPTETVVHEVTGLLVEPQASAFADAMARLACDPTLARRLGEAGLERSRLFTWGHFVDRIDDYLDSLHA